MAAGIYAGEERFFQVVTLMAPSFAKIPGGNSTTSSSGRALSISRPCRLSKTKGLLDIFPSGNWRPQPPTLVQSLPGVSQAPVRAELCPELKGVFVCHQIFIEQLLHARHRNEMKAGVRLITRRRRVWQAPSPSWAHSQATSSGRPLLALSHLLYTPIASDSSLCDSPHTSHYSIPVNPTALLDLWGWDWVPGSQVSVLA